ncbi:hypothetical protein DSM3645_28602 [Blastopirellula marina DSM 3645]|uniref:Uncharacterized protein n=1 Tax=Blastopirellula marina DSM 3645 TaxID=314230 RepID=A3ZPE2_9BACT|nr:hypothetical protein DSM3645_28602 [Blastopirellula marina DSM 3645]
MLLTRIVKFGGLLSADWLVRRPTFRRIVFLFEPIGFKTAVAQTS